MGTQLPPPKKNGGIAPNFRSMSIVAKRSPISATAELLFFTAVANYWRYPSAIDLTFDLDIWHDGSP